MESLYSLLFSKSKENRIIYYYQTFSTLKPLIDLKLSNTYVYVSSLHFVKMIKVYGIYT